jgi:hypothetical protein
MKKMRATVIKKMRGIRQSLLRVRSQRPALFAVLVLLMFSFGGLLVWGGVTITLSLNPASLESGLVLHYTFDDGDVSNEGGSVSFTEHGEFMGSTTLAAPVGNGYSNHGPYVVHDKQWIFFSNGSASLVYKTKDLIGGTWSSETSVGISSVNQGHRFAITFDGTYFHVLYRISGDARYIRLQPNPDGTVTSSGAQTVYTNATWTVDWDPFYITTDYQGRP